jgi:hypothetical protein
MMNYMQILVRITHCDVHLTYELRLFSSYIEHPFMVKVCTWLRASNSFLLVWKLLLSPWVQCLLVWGDCPCTLCYIISIACCLGILGISHLDNYFLCQSLTGYLKLQDFWSNDLQPLSEGFLNRPVLWALWQKARTRNVCATLSSNSNVYGWLWTAHNWGLAIIFASIKIVQTMFGYGMN